MEALRHGSERSRIAWPRCYRVRHAESETPAPQQGVRISMLPISVALSARRVADADFEGLAIEQPVT